LNPFHFLFHLLSLRWLALYKILEAAFNLLASLNAGRDRESDESSTFLVGVMIGPRQHLMCSVLVAMINKLTVMRKRTE
jgi:hypothetical protein